MNRELLQQIKDSNFDLELVQKPKSDEFAGVCLHSNSPVTLKDWEGPIRSFRLFSQYEYPLYFFISPDAITDDFNHILDNYGDIRVIKIPTIRNIYEFNDFSIYKQLYYIEEKHNKLLMFQEDGFLIKEGFEEFGKYDWVGALWKTPHRIISNKFPEIAATRIGNGGANLRNRQKCLEILEFINRHGGQQKLVQGLEIDGKIAHNGNFLAEDMVFCGWGYGLGLFDNTPNEDIVNKFSLEPITFKQFLNKESCLFHRVDSYE